MVCGDVVGNLDSSKKLVRRLGNLSSFFVIISELLQYTSMILNERMLISCYKLMRAYLSDFTL